MKRWLLIAALLLVAVPARADLIDELETGGGTLVLAHIDRLGYQGWIGAEYIPKGDTLEGLKWATPYLK